MERVEKVGSFSAATSEVRSLLGLPGGVLAAGHTDAAIRMWTTAGDLVATLEGHADIVRGLARGPSGELISGSWDRTIKVWVDGTAALTCTGHTGPVIAVAVSPVDNVFVSASLDYTAKVWSASTGACLATLEGHTKHVQAVCVLSTGDVVTGACDKAVRVWQRGTWTCAAAVYRKFSINTMVLLPCDSLIIGGGTRDDGFVGVWRGDMMERGLATDMEVRCAAGPLGAVAACTRSSMFVIQEDRQVWRWAAEYPVPAVLSDGRLVVAHDSDSGCVFSFFRVVRPSRLAAIHTLITAWSAHGGAPPALPDPSPEVAVLAYTLSLRRCCRPRGDTGVGRAWEMVEPFALSVLSFL